MNLDCSSVVGVLDLLGGKAVAAVAGRRHEYRPIGGIIDGDPVAWTEHLFGIGVAGIYVADLDAITAGKANDLNAIFRAARDSEIWVDAGCASPVHRYDWLTDDCGLPTNNPARSITASESNNIDHVVAGKDNGEPLSAISLDYLGEKFLGNNEQAWQTFAADFDGDVFLIDLAAVGTGNISIVERVQKLRQCGFRGRLIAGGGVRDDADVDRLINAGCDLVMVATALHPGRDVRAK